MIFGKGSKGNASVEGIFLLVAVFIIGLISVLGYMVFDNLNDVILGDEMFSEESKQTSSSLFQTYPELFDNLFVFTFVMLITFSIISAYISSNHPIFFFVSILGLFVFFAASYLLSGAIKEIFSDASLATYANDFTAMSFIINNLLAIMLGVGLIIVIVLFIKRR